jgi:hypothetical protein
MNRKIQAILRFIVLGLLCVGLFFSVMWTTEQVYNAVTASRTPTAAGTEEWRPPTTPIWDDPGVRILASLLLTLAFYALIPALIASHKGYSFFAFWLLGMFTFLIALVVALVKTPKGKLLERASIDPVTGRWVTFDNAGKRFWFDRGDWQPIH